MQKVSKKLWKSAEEPVESLLKQIAPSHKNIRRELMIALAQARFSLNRAPESIQEAVDVRAQAFAQMFSCCILCCSMHCISGTLSSAKVS